MKIAILTANLGNFDTPYDPVPQELPEGAELAFHRYTDQDFPPITGLTPRLQYRIPKLFGWQMFPGCDVYIWLDGSVTFKRPDCVKYYLDQLGDADGAFFRHPQRNTIKAEVDHIEQKLKEKNKYIVPRYHNGLHKEQYAEIMMDTGFKDDKLYTSTAFIYRNNLKSRDMMRLWWFYQSRYYTVDQISLPYAIYRQRMRVNMIDENQYKIGYLSLVSHHK